MNGIDTLAFGSELKNNVLNLRRFQHFCKQRLKAGSSHEIAQIKSMVALFQANIDNVKKNLVMSEHQLCGIYSNQDELLSLARKSKDNSKVSKGIFLEYKNSPNNILVDHHGKVPFAAHVMNEERFVTPQLNNTLRHNETTSADKIHQLLQKQKDLSSQEIESEKKEQQMLAIELSDLTATLKESSLQINKTVAGQNQNLKMIKSHAISNAAELDSQNKKMRERQKTMQTGFWASISSLIFILVGFTVTYLIIRIMPKP